MHRLRPYTLFRSSDHAVAARLEELGCETRGPDFLADWCRERALETAAD